MAGGTPIAPVLFRRARQNPNAIKRAEPPSPNIPIPETSQAALGAVAAGAKGVQAGPRAMKRGAQFAEQASSVVKRI
jgi:hypothetical protein